MDPSSAADSRPQDPVDLELARAREELRAGLQALMFNRADGDALARVERLCFGLKDVCIRAGRHDLGHLASSLQIAAGEAIQLGLPVRSNLLRRLIEQADGILYAGALPPLHLLVPDTQTRKAFAVADRVDSPFGREVRRQCEEAGGLLVRMTDLTLDRSGRAAAWEELGALLHGLKGNAVLEGDFKLAGLAGRMLDFVHAGLEADPLGLRIKEKAAPLFAAVGMRIEEVVPARHSRSAPLGSETASAAVAAGGGDAGRAPRSARSPAAPPELSAALRERLGRIRVVYVDDFLPSRRIAQRLFGQLGVPLRVAPDGGVALDLLRAEPADLVFTDVEMPRMHGYRLLAELRSRPEWQNLPVVIVTSRSAQKHRRSAETAGAADTLSKPFTHEALLEKLVSHGGLGI